MVTVVDDLLTSRGISTVPTPAAAGSGAATAPKAVPAAVPALPADSAVGKAIGMNSAITDAANAQMKSDPMLSGAIDSLVKQRGYIDQAGAEMDRRSAEMATIQAQPDPERIAVPRMKPLPPIPTLEDVAKERGVSTEDFNNPMRVFGQMMPLLVAFGALATQRPGINALNAATAAMTAVKQGDKDAYDKAHKEWLENTKIATDTNNQMITEYKLALDDRNTTMAEKQAKLAQIAAKNNDPQAKAALEKGYIEQFVQLQQMREGVTKPLITLTQLSMTEADNAKERAMRERIENARLDFQKNPPVTSTDERLASLLGIMQAKGGYTKMAPGEQEALTKALELKEKEAKKPEIDYAAAAEAARVAAGGAPAPKSPAPGPAPAPALSAAPATSGAPTTPGAPTDRTKRVPNTVYQTPRGPMLWSGTGWRPIAGGADGAGTN